MFVHATTSLPFWTSMLAKILPHDPAPNTATFFTIVNPLTILNLKIIYVPFYYRIQRYFTQVHFGES